MFAKREEEEEGGRSLLCRQEELDSITDVVKKLVEVYTNLNEDE